jgi:hypothetical protein
MLPKGSHKYIKSPHLPFDWFGRFHGILYKRLLIGSLGFSLLGVAFGFSGSLIPRVIQSGKEVLGLQNTRKDILMRKASSNKFDICVYGDIIRTKAMACLSIQ